MTVEKTKKRHGMIHSKTLISGPFPAFFFILVFSTVKLTTLNCSIKGANGWIRTWVLWHRKRPRCQLSHNNCTPPKKIPLMWFHFVLVSPNFWRCKSICTLLRRLFWLNVKMRRQFQAN